jgi:hypothetical protein
LETGTFLRLRDPTEVIPVNRPLPAPVCTPMNHAPRAISLLFLGAVVAFLLSTAISLFGSWRDPEVLTGLLTPRGSAESTIRITQAAERGVLVRSIETYDRDTGAWAEPGWLMPLAFRHRIGEDPDFAPWGNLRHALAGGQVHETEQARGWPFLAFRTSTTDGDTYRGGLLFADPLSTPGPRLTPVIPLVPIPLGLALDTLIFAAACAVPLETFRAVRRSRRRRTLRCPRCGYPRAGIAGGAPCPECGSADRFLAPRSRLCAKTRSCAASLFESGARGTMFGP